MVVEGTLECHVTTASLMDQGRLHDKLSSSSRAPGGDSLNSHFGCTPCSTPHTLASTKKTEIFDVEERNHLDWRLRGRGQSALGAFTLRPRWFRLESCLQKYTILLSVSWRCGRQRSCRKSDRLVRNDRSAFTTQTLIPHQPRFHWYQESQYLPTLP